MYGINLVNYGEVSPVPTMQLILKTCFACNNWEKLFSLALEGIFNKASHTIYKLVYTFV